MSTALNTYLHVDAYLQNEVTLNIQEFVLSLLNIEEGICYSVAATLSNVSCSF